MVANTGHAPLDVSSAAIGGAQASAFAISADGCSGHAVAPGSSCSLQLAFTPPSSGSFNAALTLEDDALGAPQTVVLSGSGEMSTVTLTPSALGFGAVAGGSTSSPEDITVTDSGSGELTVDGATIGGAQPSAFRISDDGCAGVTISAGDSCTIAVEYQPPAGGTYAATLSIADDGTGSPQQVMLSGGASLTGTVDAAADGAPVAGASVIACQAPTCTSYVEATTAADGSYTIPRLAPGLWDVNVAPTGDANLSPGSAEVTIARQCGHGSEFWPHRARTADRWGHVQRHRRLDKRRGAGDSRRHADLVWRAADARRADSRTARIRSSSRCRWVMPARPAAAIGPKRGRSCSACCSDPMANPRRCLRLSPARSTARRPHSVRRAGRSGATEAGQVPARAGSSRDLSAAARQQPVATVADDCPPPATPVPPVTIQPTSGSGIQLNLPGNTLVLNPLGFALATNNGDPFHDALVTSANLKTPALNALIGVALPAVGAYNTVVGILSAVTSAWQDVNTNPDNAFNAEVTGVVQILVAALGRKYLSQLRQPAVLPERDEPPHPGHHAA